MKVNVIPKWLEKYMNIGINNNLDFFDSMQFMNSSLDALVKNLSEFDYRYLSQEYTGDLSEWIKRKGLYPYEYMNSLKKNFFRNYPTGVQNF